jgi:hypothetical protein
MELGEQTMPARSPGWLTMTAALTGVNRRGHGRTGRAHDGDPPRHRADEARDPAGRATARDHVAARLPVENPAPASIPSYFHSYPAAATTHNGAAMLGIITRAGAPDSA